MPRTLFHTVYLDDEAGTDILIEYEQSRYDPGVCSGPPEDCYPPEGGEVEIVSMIVGVTDDGKPISYDATDAQIEKWTREIEALPIEVDDYDDYLDWGRD